MTRRPTYRDPWAPLPEYEAAPEPTLDPALVRARVYNDPTCELRTSVGYCTHLATSAALIPSGSPERQGDYRSRCPDHASPDAPRFCVTCHRRNLSHEAYHCAACSDRPSIEEQRAGL